MRPGEKILVEILGAFARTGRTPIAYRRTWKDDDGRLYACAAGAVSIDRYPKNPPRLNHAMSDEFGKRTGCVEEGWDNAIDSATDFHTHCPHCERKRCAFYEAGAAAATALEAVCR